MSTAVRDVERPAFLDRPGEGQLSLGAVASPGRARSLAERLQAERASATVAPASGSSSQTATTRGGGATLDELLVGAWEGLSSRRPVACPVCAGPMAPRVGAHGGACGDCGSQLR